MSWKAALWSYYCVERADVSEGTRETLDVQYDIHARMHLTCVWYKINGYIYRYMYTIHSHQRGMWVRTNSTLSRMRGTPISKVPQMKTDWLPSDSTRNRVKVNGNVITSLPALLALLSSVPSFRDIITEFAIWIVY